MEDVDRYEIVQMKTGISIKQNTLLYTDQNKEEAEAKVFDVIEKMRDQNNPMMSYLEKRKDSLEKRIETLEERSRELQEEISVLQEKIHVNV